jgi:hypothetical protein
VHNSVDRGEERPYIENDVSPRQESDVDVSARTGPRRAALTKMSARPPSSSRDESSQHTLRWILHIADATGWVLVAIALWHSLLDLWVPAQYYDEGILLTDAHLLLHGQFPYRDFYSNYPPGIFLVIAGLWKLVGVSVIAYRWLGLSFHLVIAALAGRLAGRISGRRFAALAAGLTLAWIEKLQAAPYAYLAALALGLAFIEIALRALERPSSRALWLLAGLALGAMSAFRHDLFLIFVAILAVLGSWRWWRKDFRLPRESLWCVGGATIPILALWIPTFAIAGPGRVADDLYFDQVRYVLPARTLPLPSLASPREVAGVELPAFVADPIAGGVVLALLGFGAGCIALVRAREASLPLALVLALSSASIPHMLGRTDDPHTLYVATPSIVLLVGIGDEIARRPWAGTSVPRALRAAPLAVFGAWLLIPQRETIFPLRPPSFAAAPEQTLPRYAPVQADRLSERRAALEFVDAHTRSGDPIYVGLFSHRRAMGNEVDLYFLLDRIGSTRYMQFDPNVVTRADVQEKMIEELERVRPAIAILTELEVWYEPNLSSQLGSPLLDQYLHSKYRLMRAVGTYRLLLRK